MQSHTHFSLSFPDPFKWESFDLGCSCIRHLKKKIHSYIYIISPPALFGSWALSSLQFFLFGSWISTFVYLFLFPRLYPWLWTYALWNCCLPFSTLYQLLPSSPTLSYNSPRYLIASTECNDTLPVQLATTLYQPGAANESSTNTWTVIVVVTNTQVYYYIDEQVNKNTWLWQNVGLPSLCGTLMRLLYNGPGQLHHVDP